MVFITENNFSGRYAFGVVVIFTVAASYYFGFSPADVLGSFLEIARAVVS